jgi:hypothetical protein
MKLRLLSLFIAFVISIFFVSAAADNAPFFITIDPVGDQTLGGEFFINGTTNLPLNETILIEIYPLQVCPGGGCGTTFQSKRTVQPGKNGINVWSCNVSTTSGWGRLRCRVGNCTGAPGADEYVLMAASRRELNVSQFQSFSILNSDRTRSFNVPANASVSIPVPTSVIQNPISERSYIQPTTPAMQSSPLLFVVPISAIILIIILGKMVIKKR